MAAVSASTLSSSVAAAAPSASLKSEFAGVQVVHGVPALVTKLPSRSLKIEAKGGKVVSTKEPLGPSGGTKFRNGIDAGGRKAKGKGVYQFTKKYGANVDGYSPIWDPNEWASSGDTYAAGSSGLALWALTLGGVLLGGLLLVYNTSALVQ